MAEINDAVFSQAVSLMHDTINEDGTFDDREKAVALQKAQLINELYKAMVV